MELKLGMYPKPEWILELPKIDPDSERIEVLSAVQFQNSMVWIIIRIDR